MIPSIPLRLLPLLLALATMPARSTDGPRLQEVLCDGPGSDADDVFVEIAGPPATPLDGWSLVGINGGDGAVYRTVSLTGAAIPADGLLVVATESANDSLAPLVDFRGNVDWQNGPDAVQLRGADGRVVDALQYGDAGPHNAGEGRPAPVAPSGQSLSRDRLGTDTDDNLADWTIQATPTPGSGLAPPDAVPGILLPDAAATTGRPTTIPIHLAYVAGHGILAVELFLTFDGDVLQAPAVAAGAALPSRWSLAAHTLEGAGTPIDTLKIAAATDTDTLAADGPLAEVTFGLARINHPCTAPLRLTHVLLNDGNPPVRRKDGSVRVVGRDGSMGLSPFHLSPPQLVEIVVRDPDHNLRPNAPDDLPLRAGDGADREDFILMEDGYETGTFLGAVSVAFGAPPSRDGSLQTFPGAQLAFCYDDWLGEDGQSLERCAIAQVEHRSPGRLAATLVCQPGDSLRLRVVDADLNRIPDSAEQIPLVAVNAAAQDTEQVVLTEAAADDSAFWGVLPTSPGPGAPGDGILTVAGNDQPVLVYLDELPHTGPPTPVRGLTQVLRSFGDADGNGAVQAYDAARVLGHVLWPVLAGMDSLAANVDARAPFGPITPLDATLILQHRVGLAPRFPVQDPGSANHPQATAAAGRPLAVDCRLELRPQGEGFEVWAEDRSLLLCGELLAQGAEEAAMAADLRGFLVASRATPEGLRVVFAGAVPAAGSGPLLHLQPQEGAAEVRLLRAGFNDGQAVWHADTAPAHGSALPTQLTLYPAYPNPFNAGTSIPFYLPRGGRARLRIYDVRGQRLRTLVHQDLRAGHHAATWDGLDGQGRPAASGLYLCHLESVAGERSRPVVLLR